MRDPPVVPAPWGRRSHLLHHLLQGAQGCAALHGEPGQVAVGLSPGLVQLALELLELAEGSFLLHLQVLVLLLVLPEVRYDLALGGCYQVLGTREM